MAKPLKFTPELGAEICARVRGGSPIAIAAQSCGVGRSTLYDWRDRPGELFEAFRAELERSAAICEQQITANLVRASRKDWKAGAFWLKCRNRELYGDEITITQQVQRATEDLFDRMQPHMSEAAFNEMLYAAGQVMGVAGVVAREVSLGGRDLERDGSEGSSH